MSKSSMNLSMGLESNESKSPKSMCVSRPVMPGTPVLRGPGMVSSVGYNSIKVSGVSLRFAGKILEEEKSQNKSDKDASRNKSKL